MIIYPKSMNQPVFTFGVFTVCCVRMEIRGTFIRETVVSSRVMTRTNIRASPLVISSGQSDPGTEFCPSTSGFPVSIRTGGESLETFAQALLLGALARIGEESTWRCFSVFQGLN